MEDWAICPRSASKEWAELERKSRQPWLPRQYFNLHTLTLNQSDFTYKGMKNWLLAELKKILAILKVRDSPKGHSTGADI